ncbi:hypothetical protein EYA84_01950 [Verrucosispora sp. SN26_14.1]|uniref:hypothetical protein n=1 Tax=Verrucosispora sp. SN26_14.1 TaxID=2527879 RepID=UPI001034E4A2|nr:hypothetical protein [Verrucosispora sp. SN26_14.1]TBL44228.1 hypothetical protein EYA84_01950 [Verrucosispora sp. SN26_14.1]
MDTTETPTVGGLRPHLAPHAAVGALVVAAGATRLAATLVGDEQAVAVWVAGSAFVIAVVAATRIRRRVFDKKARRRAYAFLAVAVGWLTGVTAVGLSLGAVGLLMALGYGLSMHWWRQHPVGLIQPKATRSEYQRRWADNVGCDGGALPGSRLTNPESIPSGVRFTLRLRPGRQHQGMLMEKIRTVRGGLKLLADQELIVEQHPTEPEPTALVTIVTRSPVKQTVLWSGPDAFDAETGQVRLGPFTDGEGYATWQVYTESRLLGGYLQGGTNGGKSRTMEMLALTIAASRSHPTVILYADGQGGASSPLLMDHADVKGRTPQQALTMLEGMYLVMQLRQDENAVMGLRGFVPADDRPGLLGFLDECHKLLDKANNPALAARTQFLVAAIASEGGKVGVALVLASQQSTLDAFGGAGSPYAEKIRGNLLTGNGAMFKGKDANAKTVFRVEVDPRTFPDMPGYAFLVNPRPGARSAPFRSCYLTDEMAEEWPKRIVWRSLDTGAAAAWGATYLRRHELAEEALEDARRRIAARRAGVVVDEPTPRPQPTTGGDGAALQVFGEVQAFPSWAQFEAEARTEARKTLKEGHEKVLAAIRAGYWKPSTIKEATGYSERQVHNLLGDLMVAGMVVKPEGSYGRYEVAPAA